MTLKIKAKCGTIVLMFAKLRKFLGQRLEDKSASYALTAFVILIPALLFLPKIGSLAPTTVYEQPGYLQAQSGKDFYDDMANAPLRGVYYAINSLSDNTLYLRLAAALVAALATITLFLVLKRITTIRVTLLTMLMFVTSSWVLHTARFANIEVLYLLVIPALFLVGLWATSKADDNKLPLSVLLLSVILYVPGAWLFLLAGAIIYWKQIKRIWCKISLGLRLGGLGLLLVLISPLVFSFSQRSEALFEWLGVRNFDDLSLQQIGSNLLFIPDALFFSGIDEPTAWLKGTPILDFFAVAMFIIGIFAYRKSSSPTREYMVFSSLAICILLVAVGGPSRLGLIIPLVYFLIARGIAYMLQSWFTVFPRNPMARSIGISFIIAAVFISSSYQLQRYFIAWPNSPVIKELRQ